LGEENKKEKEEKTKKKHKGKKEKKRKHEERKGKGKEKKKRKKKKQKLNKTQREKKKRGKKKEKRLNPPTWSGKLAVYWRCSLLVISGPRATNRPRNTVPPNRPTPRSLIATYWNSWLFSRPGPIASRRGVFLGVERVETGTKKGKGKKREENTMAPRTGPCQEQITHRKHKSVFWAKKKKNNRFLLPGPAAV